MTYIHNNNNRILGDCETILRILKGFAIFVEVLFVRFQVHRDCFGSTVLMT